MDKLKKLIADVNAMDIQNQIGTFGDAFLPTHAGLELQIVEKRLAKLEGFVKKMLELSDWPDGGEIDGNDFQDACVEFGILIPEQKTVPCGEDCKCAEFYDEGEEVTCYRIGE